MTISTSQSAEIFLGNGVTNTFAFSFVATEAADISVILTDTDGVVTTLSPSQYTLFLNPPATGALWGIGGTVTYPIMGSPIVDNTILTVSRILPLTQVDSISNQGNFAPQVIEQALDTLEMQIQQVNGRTGLFRGTWLTATAYSFGDQVIDGANGLDTGNYYTCIIANTSGTWSTDLTAGYWQLAIDIAGIEADVTAAAASAAAAATSATNAATSASSASTSASSASTSATTATTQATNAAASAAAAATSASTAASYAASLSSTSVTSVAIATGAKTFTTQASKQYSAGQYLIIASNASALNYMHGTVTSYSGTSLVMNITDIGGSGTYTDWNISLSGTQGPTGAAGASGAFSGLTGGTNTTAAMVVGTGSSISATGSGAITATTIPASGITGNTTVAQGGTGLTTLTANNVVLGNGTSAVQFVAPSTSGNVLTSNGTTWQSSPATGGNILLQTKTASSSATIDFTSVIDSTYKKYLIECINVIPASDAILYLRYSTDNGGSYPVSGYNYHMDISTMQADTYLGINSTSAVAIFLTGTIESSGYQGYCGSISLYNPSSATPKSCVTTGCIVNSSGDVANASGAGSAFSITAPVTAIRFLMSTGNIASGTFKLYGVP